MPDIAASASPSSTPELFPSARLRPTLRSTSRRGCCWDSRCRCSFSPSRLTFRSCACAPAAAHTRWRGMTSWLTLFFASALLLPPLPISLGNSGPHLCLLFAALGLLFGIASLTHWRVVPCSLNAAFTAFFGVLFASIALAAIHSGVEAAAASFARVALLSISIYVFFFTAYGPAPMFDALHATRRVYVFAALSALFAC